MTDKKQLTDEAGGSVNLGRHESQCTVCSSPYRQQIEAKWINWGSTYEIAEQYR
jgi:hypothetical protein